MGNGPRTCQGELVVNTIGDIGRIHPKFGRCGQTSRAFSRNEITSRERTELGKYNHHPHYHVRQTRWQAQAFEGKNNIY